MNRRATAHIRRRGHRQPVTVRVGGDRGASTLEAAILAPVVLMLIAVAVISMRIEVAAQAVESAEIGRAHV